LEMTEAGAPAGASPYSRFVLGVYDWYVLGYNCRYLWRCPARNLLDLYNRHVSNNHLDIGVGTGYFMDRCRFPSASVRLALMDSNPNSLSTAGRRLARYRPEMYRRNVIEKLELNAPPFDSVGMMNLLHCLPGDLKTKAVAFENVKEVMNPGAVLFGSTILYQGVRRNPMATLAIKYYNRKGFMTNLSDSLGDLRESLRGSFPESSVKIIGCEALFWARK
jgi:ubiquinone/menaquinone biosynthesis C-methylase UbiE